jgi:hypothetical protein
MANKLEFQRLAAAADYRHMPKILGSQPYLLEDSPRGCRLQRKPAHKQIRD